MNPLFRYQADRVPVIIIVLLTLLDFILYFLIDNVWVLLAYLAVMIIPKGCICAWNHHHQHTKTFSTTFLNRLLEQSYALHTGATTNLWLLHHVLGHHHNFLDQSKDESRWKRKDGTTMGELEYTLNVAGTAYWRGFVVGRRYPHHYRTHLIYTLITFVTVAALVWYRPIPGLIIFLIPMILGLLITAWATYDHHAGLDEQDEMCASYNNMNPLFNLVTGNLGYHTAHHHQQGVHWSELPLLHAEIKEQIPENLYRTSYWDLVTDLPIIRSLFRPVPI